MESLRVLVVEDEAHYRQDLARELNARGNVVSAARTAAEAATLLAAEKFDLCFLDLHLSEEDGFSGLKLISAAKDNGVYTVVLTGHADPELINLAKKLGCDEYRLKSEGIELVAAIARRVLAQRATFLTEDMYRYALDHGLNALVERITDMVLDRNVAKNKGIQNAILRDLDISNTLYYNYMRRRQKSVPGSVKKRFDEHGMGGSSIHA